MYGGFAILATTLDQVSPDRWLMLRRGFPLAAGAFPAGGETGGVFRLIVTGLWVVGMFTDAAKLSLRSHVIE